MIVTNILINNSHSNSTKSREQLLWTRYSMHHRPGGALLVHVTGSASSA